ncbi:glycosyltransferase family 39 protein [Larkinella sp. VNQ87]|uniref:glycosyltransferase family 39 protein n=1 Tax=Larkinella sp. VNQ87 TaxID=3400921 RepID=UPI003C12AD78
MSSHHRTYTWILAGIMLLAFVLRVYHLDSYGIFFDEKSTLLVSQGVVLEGSNQKDVFDKAAVSYFTPEEFWKPKTLDDFIEANIKGDIGNSPAYYALIWLWIKAFGPSDFSIRFLSVLFGVITLPLLYRFVTTHFKMEPERAIRLALLTCLLAAIEPYFIAQSHVARNYTMSFFLTLLATQVFLLIQEKQKPNPRTSPINLYVAYGLLVALSLLSHYLTLTVFLGHGLYALLYVRKLPVWFRLALSVSVAVGFVSLWFIFGGGKYTFFSLDHQAKLYRSIALTNPTNNGFGLILPATVPNVFWRSLPVFSDLILFTNGLATAVVGYRNFALAMLLGGLATGLLIRYRKHHNPPVWVKIGFPLVLAAGLPIYSIHAAQHLVMSAAVPLFYLLVTAMLEDVDRQNRPLMVFLVILALGPTFFLLIMAFRSGHTYGITQRYSGFSFPYILILTALMLLKISSLRFWFSLPLAVVLAVQAVFLTMLLQRIYNDIEPKYSSAPLARLPNPFRTSAQKIQELYAPGDTVLYPSMRRHEYTEIDKIGRAFSVIDAQMVNVYLPRDATYYQRIDSTERDKIVLVKGKTGQKITIFDLEGMKYRY